MKMQLGSNRHNRVYSKTIRRMDAAMTTLVIFMGRLCPLVAASLKGAANREWRSRQ